MIPRERAVVVVCPMDVVLSVVHHDVPQLCETKCSLERVATLLYLCTKMIGFDNDATIVSHPYVS